MENFCLAPEVFFHLGGVPRAPGLSLTPHTHFSWGQESGIRSANTGGKTGRGNLALLFASGGRELSTGSKVLLYFPGKLCPYVGKAAPVQPTGGKASEAEFSIRMLTCPQV